MEFNDGVHCDDSNYLGRCSVMCQLVLTEEDGRWERKPSQGWMTPTRTCCITIAKAIGKRGKARNSEETPTSATRCTQAASTANICSAPTRSTEGHELGKNHTAKPNQRSIKLTSRNSNGTQPQEVHEQIYLPRETLMGPLKFSRARSPRFPPNFNKMSPNCQTDLLEQPRCSCCS